MKCAWCKRRMFVRAGGWDCTCGWTCLEVDEHGEVVPVFDENHGGPQ